MSSASPVETLQPSVTEGMPARSGAALTADEVVGVAPGMKRSTRIAFAILLAASILLVIGLVLMIWKPLLMAAVLAGTFSGLHDRLARRLRQRRVVSAAIFTIGVIVLVLVPLSFLVVIGVQQAIAAVAFVREALESGGMRELIRALPDAIQPSAIWLFDRLQSGTTDLQSEVASSGQFAFTFIRDALSTTSGVLFRVAICLITFFALLTDGKRFIAWIEETLPFGGARMRELLREFRLVSSSAIGTVAAASGAQAVAATIGFLIAGVPQPAFFGLLTFFAAFIPSIGSAIVAIPIAGLLLLIGKTFAGIFLLAWSLLVVGLVDNLVKPLLMKGRLNVHAAIVFLALVAGLLLFGPIGLLVGPLAISFLLAMLRLGRRDFT